MNILTPEEKAEELIEKYNSEGIAPFPFEKIQDDKKDLVISMLDDMSDDVSGAIIFDKDDATFHIVINDKKSETRKYFTLAHEVGHYFLHQKIIKENKGHMDMGDSYDLALYRKDDPISAQEEVEANRFAAALIMPEKLVLKAWRELGDVTVCAKVFGVSVAAMSIRLERLRLL